jgi:capsular exopolysaccharide synthesis family protein
LVQQRRGGFSPSVSDFSLSGQLALTYGTQVRSTPFFDQVTEKNALDVEGVSLNTGRLKGMVSTATSDKPPTVTISVRHGDPKLAATVANVLASEFIEYVIQQRLVEISNLQTSAASQGLTNVQDLVSAQAALIDSITLLEPAQRPGNPILPRTRYNVILAIALGGAVSIGLSLLLSALRDTVRSPEELQRRFGVASLGTVFTWASKEAAADQLVMWHAPTSGYSESLRQIRANVQFATAGNNTKVFLVTSPGPSEGKTTILSNLTIAMAQTGKRVVAVDGDLRRPTVHRRFQLKGREIGLSNFLSEPNLPVENVVVNTEIEGVSIIPAGPIPPNPSELLGSPRMAVLLEQLAEKYDVVFVDSPPTLMAADAPVIAAQVGEAIVVVDGSKTRTSSLKGTLESLRNSQVHILGVVLNKLKRGRFGYGYGYGYQYNYYRYYRMEEEGDVSANGAGPAYKRPLVWARSVLSKLPLPRDRS